MMTLLPCQRPANALAWHLTAAATYGVSAEGMTGVGFRFVARGTSSSGVV